MDRTMIGDLREKIGQQVKVQGWLQRLRDQKKMQFLIVRDRTGLVQVVNERGCDPALAEAIARLPPQVPLTITGKVVDNPAVRLGGLEVALESFRVEGTSESQLPFDPFAEPLPALDFRLDWRFLDLRRPESQLIFRVATLAEMAMREFWLGEGFIEIHTPKLMGSPSESGAELFELPYFGSKAYLAQSPQFYKQMAMAAGFERVFEIGPAFRADPSFTSRHMTEFTSIDMEMSWIESEEDVMRFLEGWLSAVYARVKEVYGPQIRDRLGVEIQPLSLPFPRMPMREALRVLQALYGYTPPADKKGDIDPAGERLLGQYVREKFGHDFFFLTEWPVSARPFYHMCCPGDPSLTRSFDLIAKGLEIVTGAQREHRYQVLKAQALEKGLTLEPIRFYLDFFRYGCPPHGGLAVGLARLLMVMLGIQNIREAVFLFRGPMRLEP